jgi:hypothetical protein
MVDDRAHRRENYGWSAPGTGLLSTGCWCAREVAPPQIRDDECVAGCRVHTIGSSSRASLGGRMIDGTRVCRPTCRSIVPVAAVSAAGDTCLSCSAPPRRDAEIGSPAETRPSSIEGAIEMNAGSPASTPHRQLLWNCPRCGLSITPRVRWLAIEHCPRCMARAHLPVRLISSPPATGTVHPQRSTLTNRQGAWTTDQSGPR